MTMTKKDIKQIKILRERKHNLKQIGKVFGITAERVRQILNSNKAKFNRCRKHRCKYTYICQYCDVIEKYSKVLKRMGKNQLLAEIVRLRYTSREKYQVIMKSLLIKKIRNEYNLSFREIARRFNFDHTSVIYLYNKKI